MKCTALAVILCLSVVSVILYVPCSSEVCAVYEQEPTFCHWVIKNYCRLRNAIISFIIIVYRSLRYVIYSLTSDGERDACKARGDDVEVQSVTHCMRARVNGVAAYLRHHVRTFKHSLCELFEYMDHEWEEGGTCCRYGW